MFYRTLAFILLLLSSATMAWAQSDKIALEGKTQTRAAAGERVRVIVDYVMPAQDLPIGVAGAPARRTMVSSTRVSVLKRAFGDKITAYKASDAQPQTDQPRIVRQLENAPSMAMMLTRAEMEKLAADPMVKGIYTDRISHAYLDDSTVLVGAPVVWNAGNDGADYAVAVLDTGSNHDHIMMSGKVVGSACFSTTNVSEHAVSLCPDGSELQTGAPAGTNCPVDDPATDDNNPLTDVDVEGISGCDHGTHVASTAMGSSFSLSSGTTILGVAKGANLVAVQVFTKFTDNESCDDSPPCVASFNSDQNAGLDFVLTNAATMKIASVNMSLGGSRRFPDTCDGGSNATMKGLIDQLRAAGVATVIASGNDSFTNGVGSPGCISSAVTVGATSKQDAVAGFSNSSSLVDLLAPGVSILAAYPQVAGVNYGATLSGTSMATPHVAGAFALLKSAHPTASVQDIEDALKATGKAVLDTKNQLFKPRIRVDLASALLANGGGAGIGQLAIAPADGFFSIGDPGVSASFGTKTYTLTNNTGASVSWTAAADQTFILLTKTSGTLAAGATDTVIVSVDASKIANGGEGAEDGTITFSVGADTTIRAVGASAFIPPPPPVNNDFNNALPLSGAQPTITGSSVAANKEAGEPNHIGGSNAGGASIWYKWTAPLSAAVKVSTKGSNFDTVLGVYTGTNVGALTAVGNNDDEDNPNGLLTSLVSFNAVKGTTYFIAIDGFDGEAGNAVLALTVSGVPTNNDFANAQTISGAMGSTFSNNINATAQVGEPKHAGSSASAKSIWFDWTAPSAGDFSFNTDGSDFDTVLAVYTGTALNALSEVVSNDNNGVASITVSKPAFTPSASQVTFSATSGTIYHIAVAGQSTASGLVNLGWSAAGTALPNLVTAVLPYARSVKVGTQATAFMTVINAGTVEGTNCLIELAPGDFQGGFTYQATDGANAPTDPADTPVTIAAGAAQNFIFAVTPSTVISQKELGIQARCGEGTSSNVVTGVNSFILSSAAVDPADMLAIGVTSPAGGIVSIPGASGAAAASIATSALGGDATLTASADDGGLGLPLVLNVCETNSATGACLATPAAGVTINSVGGETRTFGLFVTATGDIPFLPGVNRIFVRFKDANGVVRGATNFAVRTDE